MGALFKPPIGVQTSSITDATSLNGKTEGNLSVASAVTSSNSLKLNNKSENELVVASAVTSSNALKLNNKSENELIVASATTLGEVPIEELTVAYAGEADRALAIGYKLAVDIPQYADLFMHVKSMSIFTPPESPSIGDTYWLPTAGATGTAWESFGAGRIIVYRYNSETEANEWAYYDNWNAYRYDS